MLSQRHRRWPSIALHLANVSVIWVVAFLSSVDESVIHIEMRCRPTKHGTITQCCLNAEQASNTLGQHCKSIG